MIDEDPVGATETSRKTLISYRSACWIINNLVFSIIFLVLIGVINRIGLTRYAGVATLATVSISPGESAISIRGFL